MELEALTPEAVAAMPRPQAIKSFTKLTSYELARARRDADAVLDAASRDVEAILERRRKTDELLRTKAKEIAASRECLRQALADPEPNYADDEARLAGAAHGEWLGSLLAVLDTEAKWLESFLAERKGLSA